LGLLKWNAIKKWFARPNTRTFFCIFVFRQVTMRLWFCGAAFLIGLVAAAPIDRATRAKKNGGHSIEGTSKSGSKGGGGDDFNPANTAAPNFSLDTDVGGGDGGGGLPGDSLAAKQGGGGSGTFGGPPTTTPKPPDLNAANGNEVTG
jgi:hypothetical protein